MADTELLPCPFCGGTDLSIETNSVQPDDFHDAWVNCGECNADGRHAMTLEGWLPSKAEAKEEAVVAWNRRAALASRPAEVDEWISVDDRMPGKERCLAVYVNAAGKHRVIRAMYAGQFQIDAGEDAIDQGNCEYNEADDTFYLKAGWLECIDNWDDYSSIYVTEGTVTHWRRLPAAPSHTTNKDNT